jgi:hypothetical protein
MPSVKWMEAEERIFNDPEYQRAQAIYIDWIEQLQRAQTADDLDPGYRRGRICRARPELRRVR